MRTISLRILRPRGLLLSAAFTFSACSSSAVGNPPDAGRLDANAFGQKYKVADSDIAGWTLNPAPDSYDPLDVYTDSNLNDRIDGGATAYVSGGCRMAMYQQMLGPSPNSCVVIAMDFVSEDQATAMFTYEQQHLSGPVAIPQYDASTAFGYPVLNGLSVYTHFKAMYFEVQLNGNPDQTSASQVAASFLKVLEAK